jgi:hypothetical protein
MLPIEMGVCIMAIKALYPSRQQSHRRNPLFDRERLARRLSFTLILGLSLLSLLGLRYGPAVGAAEARTIDIQGDRGTFAAPFAPRRNFTHDTSVNGTSVVPAPRKPIRVIPLFAVPADAAGVIPHGGYNG